MKSSIGTTLTRISPKSARSAALLIGAAALVGMAAYVHTKTRQAEQAFPPQGRFLEVNGVKLHFTESGSGPVIVLLHGNGAMVEDFELSGLVDELSKKHRVISFDRPGYGHSTRPSDQQHDPEAQAKLFHDALQLMGVEHPLVVGHSWGTLVATAMALNYPSAVRAIALLSGYYIPTPRLDVWLMAAPAIPVIGTLMRHTVSPVMSCLMWKMVSKKLFAPNEVPPRFSRFPKWMALRPSQLLASAQESAMMVPFAKRLSKRYGELTVPVLIVGGDKDKIVRTPFQTAGLSEKINAHPKPIILRDTGHMLHYVRCHELADALQEMSVPVNSAA